MVYVKSIPVKSEKNPHNVERVLFGVYCSKEDAEFIDVSLKDLGATRGRSGFFVKALIKYLGELGYKREEV